MLGFFWQMPHLAMRSGTDGPFAPARLQQGPRVAAWEDFQAFDVNALGRLIRLRSEFIP